MDGRLSHQGGAYHDQHGGIYGHFNTASTRSQHAMDCQEAWHSQKYGQKEYYPKEIAAVS